MVTLDSVIHLHLLIPMAFPYGPTPTSSKRENWSSLTDYILSVLIELTAMESAGYKFLNIKFGQVSRTSKLNNAYTTSATLNSLWPTFFEKCIIISKYLIGLYIILLSNQILRR